MIANLVAARKQSSPNQPSAENDGYAIQARAGGAWRCAFTSFAQANRKAVASRILAIEDFFGLGIFHYRLQPDTGWNPPSLAFDRELQRLLEQPEVTYASDPKFMNRQCASCWRHAPDPPTLDRKAEAHPRRLPRNQRLPRRPHPARVRRVRCGRHRH